MRVCFQKLGFQVSRIPPKPVVSDGLITIHIGNFDMLATKTHALPYYLKIFPWYSSQVPRLTLKVKEKYPEAILIDIGANIGDTVALVRSKVHCPIVCLEGSENFFHILQKNIRQFPEVFPFRLFIGDSNTIIYAKTQETRGTLKIVEPSDNKEGEAVPLTTLDTFLNEHLEYRAAKILKIDTDGYDPKIIRGAVNYLSETKPVIFFECDRIFFTKLGENGMHTLRILQQMGYHHLLFYDNCGRFLLATETGNHRLIQDLYGYMEGTKGRIDYYDLCLFHSDDDTCALEFINAERLLRDNNENPV